MSNKVFKNYQINLGVPFQVKVPLEELLDGYYLSSGKLDIGDRISDAGGDRENGAASDDEFRVIAPGGIGRIAGAGGRMSGSGGRMSGAGGRITDSGGRMSGAGRRITGLDGANIFGVPLEDIDDDFCAGGGAGYDGEEEGAIGEAGDADGGELDEVEAARAEADKILREAHAESEGIIAAATSEAQLFIETKQRDADAYYRKKLEQALTDADTLREQAWNEGNAEGRDEGKAAYEELINEARQWREKAEEEYGRLMAGAENDALELILGIAKKVIGEEITQNRDSLLHMVKDAFLHCTNKEDTVLKVSAEDYDYLLVNRDKLLSMVEGLDKLEIKRDLALTPGACLIETPFGNLNAGVAMRLSKIEDAFYSLLAANRPS